MTYLSLHGKKEFLVIYLTIENENIYAIVECGIIGLAWNLCGYFPGCVWLA